MISYAGVKLNAPNKWLEDEIESKISLRHVQQTVRKKQPSFMESHWDRSGYGADQRIRLNVLNWPVGATSWAMFHGIVNGTRLQQIRTAAVTSGALVPQTLVMDDDRYKIEADLYALPPRPLFKGSEASENLYLLTLVDARYWWQSWGLDITFSEGVMTWSTLYAAIASAIGATLSADTVPAAYGSPSRDILSLQYSAGSMLDAVASSVGHRIVRNLDGTVEAQRYPTSSALVANNLQYTARAGGKLEVFDLGGGTPGTFRAVFPTTWASVLQNSNVYASDVSLASLGFDGQAVSGPGVKTYRSTMVAACPNGGGTPTNAAEVDALATQAATDFYGWRQDGYDVVIPGLFPWNIEGQHGVEWSFRHDKAATRVYRCPLNDGPECGHHYGSGGSLSLSYGGDAVSRSQTNHGYLVTVPQNLTVASNGTLTLPGAETVRANPSGAYLVHGFAGGVSGKRHRLWNVGGASLTLVHQSGSAATAEDRIICSTGGNITVAPNESVEVEYDLSSSRWRASIAVASNTTVDISSVENLTVTNSLTSENYTLLENYVDITAATVNFTGTQVQTYSGGTLTLNRLSPVVQNYNSTFTQNINASFTQSFFGVVVQTYNSTLNMTFNGVVTNTFNANVTYSFVGAIVFTICGNTTICENKTLSLPKMIGNMNGSILQAVPSSSSNAAVPGRFQFLNGVMEMTNITGTPTTPDTGTTGLYVDDADGKLYIIDDTGTSYPVANTGNGTSNGSLGYVQLADGSGSFIGYANATYDDSIGEMIVPYLRSTTLGDSFNTVVTLANIDGELIPNPPMTTVDGLVINKANQTLATQSNATFTDGQLTIPRVRCSDFGDTYNVRVAYFDAFGNLLEMDPAGSGNYTLKSVDGVLTWVSG